VSKATKDAGHKAVALYEREKGRTVDVHEKDGYDLISRGRGEIRHIEVKATAKSRFQWRWLTDAEFRAAVSDPDFYLYLVTDALSERPRITEMRRDELLQRYKGVTILHVISFPKKLEAAEPEEDVY
jgi:hypothetical protein